MKLDCDTPLGQVFMQEQFKTQEVLEGRGYVVVNTPGKDHHSDIMLAKEMEGKLTLFGIAEIKCRRMAGDQVLNREYVKQNGYLVTEHKLKYGAMVSSMYKVPFFLIVNLLLDNRILVWQVTDRLGNYTMDIKTLETKTQATCNGGSTIRRNAFLHFDTKYLTEIVYE